jgi:hypothetical protein
LRINCNKLLQQKTSSKKKNNEGRFSDVEWSGTSVGVARKSGSESGRIPGKGPVAARNGSGRL